MEEWPSTLRVWACGAWGRGSLSKLFHWLSSWMSEIKMVTDRPNGVCLLFWLLGILVCGLQTGALQAGQNGEGEGQELDWKKVTKLLVLGTHSLEEAPARACYRPGCQGSWSRCRSGAYPMTTNGISLTIQRGRGGLLGLAQSHMPVRSKAAACTQNSLQLQRPHCIF
jgi:hypothetical protein